MTKYLILLFISLVLIPKSVQAEVFDYGSIPNGPGFYNVKTMGAKGDGVSDDTAIINNAIAQTRYPNGGGVVYLPEGRYLVTGINATYLNGTTIVGAGMDKTFLISAGFEGSVVDTLGSNYLTVAKLSIGLRNGATADTGIVMGASGPPSPASSTANTLDQVAIEDSGSSSSFNIASLLVANSGDAHITDSKFISRNRSTTPAVTMTGNAKILGLRSPFAGVIDPTVDDAQGASLPTDNTFYNVLIRKETAGTTGALSLKGAEARFFDSKIESADPQGVVASEFVLNTLFYNTQIVPVNQAQFSGACIQLPPSATPAIHVHGLSFDPPNCNSAIGPIQMREQNMTFRVLYPGQAFTSDVKKSKGLLANNVPHFYTADSLFPSPPPYQATSPTPAQKIGDIDQDGDVDVFDFNQLVTDFTLTGSGLVADINKNGRVDLFDFNLLVGNFGK